MPYKLCTYSCIYCQLGRTIKMTIERKPFYDPQDIVRDVAETLAQTKGEVDFVTFVPDGEPLLDLNIAAEITGIRHETGSRIAVLTNASLLYQEQCRLDLAEADLVSVKVDAASEQVWKRINRPHPSLRLSEILEGIREFANTFKGRLITETMLVEGFNDSRGEIRAVAEFIASINPHKAYLAVPVRPPAEPYATPPPPEKLVEAYNTFTEHIGRDKVELLNMPEPPPETLHGDPAQWILSTTSVHPLRYTYAVKLLEKKGENPEKLLSSLKEKNLIRIVEYRGEKFITRTYRS
ncbi:radical SAM protein [Infirmifilum uzonense]|uniref:radical SAM protein n=1 Tax=Infirmifilum uzonense TaxID=1550241 RepID=UPI00069C0E1F|nr:radical SAM protein [Infirmifilum uzonense]